MMKDCSFAMADGPTRRVGFSAAVALTILGAGLVFGGGFAAPAQSPAPTKDAAAATPPAEPLALTPQARPRGERAPALDLEAAVSVAELVIVARLDEVTETTIVRGGRTAQVTQQFRLKPLRVLKGIFDRDELLMTGEDLGIYRFAEGPGRLTRGDLLLVMLGRQGLNYFNCCPADTLEQSIPRLRDEANPLIEATAVLVEAVQQRSRGRAAALLVRGLSNTPGRAAVPLLRALARRATLAAQIPGVPGAVGRHFADGDTTLRVEAARAIGTIIAADYREQPEFRREVAESLGRLLAAAPDDLAVRLAAIEALGNVGPVVREVAPAAAWLPFDPAQTGTLAEQAARLRAIAKSAPADQKPAVDAFVSTLALDAPDDLQSAALWALLALDAEAAVNQITRRIQRKAGAGLPIVADLTVLGEAPANRAAAVLLAATRPGLNDAERLAFVAVARKVADSRLVPALATMLDPRNYQVRIGAIDALRAIDTDEAASVLAPHAAAEADPARRLLIYAFLGKHGMRDGYQFALEQLGQPTYAPWAIEALAAIRHPDAVADLRRVRTESHSNVWSAAAIRALGRLGDAESRDALRALAVNPSNPLADAALDALCAMGDEQASGFLLRAFDSRSEERLVAAARAARAFLPTRDDANTRAIRERLASLLADPEAPQAVRAEALSTLGALKDPRLADALRAAIDDRRIENTPLLNAVEAEAAKQQVDLGPLLLLTLLSLGC
jgi:HEAT repeat protein